MSHREPQNHSAVLLPEVSRQSQSLRQVFMLVAQVHSQDPRVAWQADTVAKRAKVTVLGVHPQSIREVSREEKPGYTAINLVRQRKKKLKRRKAFEQAVYQVLNPFQQNSLPEFLTWARFMLMWPFLAFYAKLCTKTKLKKFFKNRNHPAGMVQQFLKFKWLLSYMEEQAVTHWSYWEQATVKPDVVHCHDLDTLLVGVLCKQQFGSRLVYDAHEFWAYSYEHAADYQTQFFLWLEKRLTRYADRVSTVNPYLAKLMADTYQLPHVESLPNCEPWLETSERVAYVPQPNTPTLQQLAGNRVKFLFQGGFATTRGIEELITAWQWMDADRAVLFLRGPENAFHQHCVQLAESLGILNKSVFFLEPVREEELVMAAQEADIGIIPYLPVTINNRLACPNKLSQYMQAGLMVISANLVYVEEMIQRYTCGSTYEWDNPQSLVACLKQAVDDPSYRESCQSNALKFGKIAYNWQQQCGALATMYEEFWQ